MNILYAEYLICNFCGDLHTQVENCCLNRREKVHPDYRQYQPMGWDYEMK